ncbi:putative RNA recognition motif domain, nucleotide-binding alpha-beta plait domain superfamily [Plasmopara halstedii]
METECKTLWMGDIQMHWMKPLLSRSLLRPVKAIQQVRIFRISDTARSSASTGDVQRPTYPKHVARFRMNWGAGGRRIETSDDHSIFCSFTTVRGAKVVMDPITRMSKGFGFVRFGSKRKLIKHSRQ